MTQQIKEQLEEVIKKNLPEKKSKKNQGYDGNNLESANDCYGISASGWSEIIRFEDGYNEALYDIPISLIADEVLKVVVETCCKDCRKMIELSNENTQ